MRIGNAVEDAVRTELDRFTRELGEDARGCQCPLCRADTIALALSTLPPRYYTDHRGDAAFDERHMDFVRQGIARAWRQVRQQPRHTPGGSGSSPDEVRVVNFPLEESFHLSLRPRNGSFDACCWKCTCDMVAFTLNRYPARYGVSRSGRTLLTETDRRSMRDELGFFLNLARQVVTTFPHH